MADPQTFHYTYSAKQQEEIDSIRKKYLPPEEDKMAQLRRLDRSSTAKGTRASIALGLLGCLLLGLGMSCSMVWQGSWFIPGIVIGIVGIAAVTAAWPLYTRITKKERARLAPQILQLTEELSRADWQEGERAPVAPMLRTGKQAPVALCSEPTEAEAETRGGSREGK